jgi:hypothetical protein
MAPPEEHCCVRRMSFLDYVGKWPGMRQSRDEGMHSYAGHPAGAADGRCIPGPEPLAG